MTKQRMKKIDFAQLAASIRGCLDRADCGGVMDDPVVVQRMRDMLVALEEPDQMLQDLLFARLRGDLPKGRAK